MDQPSQFFVYILRCSDGSYYVGQTENIKKRVTAHNDGKAASWTTKRRPVALVYHEAHENRQSAVQRESQLKKWSRAKKEALISGDLKKLKELSKRRSS